MPWHRLLHWLWSRHNVHNDCAACMSEWRDRWRNAWAEPRESAAQR